MQILLEHVKACTIKVIKLINSKNENRINEYDMIYGTSLNSLSLATTIISLPNRFYGERYYQLRNTVSVRLFVNLPYQMPSVNANKLHPLISINASCL